MELFRTDQYYIFINGEFGLWWNRKSGEFEAKTGWDLASADDPECLGIFHGIVGKIELPSILDSRLMLIKECQSVGDLPGGKTVYKIQSIVFLQLHEEPTDLGLAPCKKHQHMKNAKKSTSGGMFDIQQNAVFAKTWGTFKSATNSIKNTTQQAAALATSQVKLTKRRDSKDREKFERRILEELQRIFTETDSFYFSLTADLTNSIQRQWELKDKTKGKQPHNLWRNVDDRFFWNKHMLQEIIQLDSQLADPWILPIIQGFVQIEPCKVEVGFEPIANEALEPRYETFTLALISRRSRHRAGTRYKRRGVDDAGRCANYVETEQLVSHHHHQVSFVQVRGSVPVFWSQPGYKYRPPPRIDKGEAETQVVFEKHFEEETNVYGPVCIVNLVDQLGREKVIWDAYTDHVLAFNSPQLTYATFDFHEYCRGMHFENVSVLVAHLEEVIRDMGYCWMDREGKICLQKGVFRINCIDCLDRTNVVQTALGKAVMETQFTKLGLIPPEGLMPANIRSTFQLLWANNGDTISKQYAGTNALKGDYTRTGERKISGMMKDGMNSANRYYRGHFVDLFRQGALDLMLGAPISIAELTAGFAGELETLSSVVDALMPLAPSPYMSHLALGPEVQLASAIVDRAGRYYLSRFKDVYRQATIDLMVGNPVSEDLLNQERHADEEDSVATAEHVKLLIEDCKKMLIADTEVVLGAWGLIDADPATGDAAETDMDTILILTRDSYYMADYDHHLDRVTKYQRVGLWQLTLIELGPITSMFKPGSKPGPHCLRIGYTVDQAPGYCHTFRSTGLRFFNNMAVAISSPDEMIESLKAICETLAVGVEVAGLPPVPLHQGRLERRKSKLPPPGGCTVLGGFLDPADAHMTRNVSETQLLALKNVGSKALSNMSQQFNKLNKLGHSFNTRKPAAKNQVAGDANKAPPKATFHVGPIDKDSSLVKVSSDEDDEEVTLFNQGTSLLSHNTRDKKINSISDGRSNDAYMPSVGIVMSTKVNAGIESLLENKTANRFEKNLRFVSTADPLMDQSLSQANVSPRKHVLTHSRTDLSLDVSSLVVPPKESASNSLTPSPSKRLSTTPEITFHSSCFPNDNLCDAEKGGDDSDGAASSKSKLTPPNTLQLGRKLSRSSGYVDGKDAPGGGGKRADEAHRAEGRLGERSSSERDLTFSITSSQSENALRSIRSGLTNVITSPVAATRDLVLSPFSKLAKGMQSLGANLDPRRLKGAGAGAASRYAVTEQHLEELRKLEEKWKKSKTRLIAL